MYSKQVSNVQMQTIHS